MKAPKCKICGEEHWGPICPKFARKKAVPAPVAQRVKEIEARPIKLGSKGRTRKAKAKKRQATKQAKRQQVAEKTAKPTTPTVD